jgi:hypothetical protein
MAVGRVDWTAFRKADQRADYWVWRMAALKVVHSAVMTDVYSADSTGSSMAVKKVVMMVSTSVDSTERARAAQKVCWRVACSAGVMAVNWAGLMAELKVDAMAFHLVEMMAATMAVNWVACLVGSVVAYWAVNLAASKAEMWVWC